MGYYCCVYVRSFVYVKFALLTMNAWFLFIVRPHIEETWHNLKASNTIFDVYTCVCVSKPTIS